MADQTTAPGAGEAPKTLTAPAARGKGKPTAKPAAAPVAKSTRPAPALSPTIDATGVIRAGIRPDPEPLRERLWLVRNSDNMEGRVLAFSKSSAKYAFMKAKKVIDTQQVWDISPVEDEADPEVEDEANAEE